MNMTKKLIVVFLMTCLGSGGGALLGYGPLLRYKTDGVVSVDMGTTEYKRFTELANDVTTLQKYLMLVPMPGMDTRQFAEIAKIVAQGKWHSPVPRVSKADTKELSSLSLQMEQDREKERDSENPLPVYLGLRVTYSTGEPEQTAKVAIWLGGYALDVAANAAVRYKVSRWKAENWKFSDRALAKKLRFEFAIEQAQTRAARLTKVVASYPELTRREGSQVVDVRKDNEKFMSPLAQLIAAESEIIDIRQELQTLDRELEKQTFAQTLIKEIEPAMAQARDGSEAIAILSALISSFEKKVKSPAEREGLLSLMTDLSDISGRFLSQAQFISQPPIPTQPERPAPLLVIVIAALISALLAAAFVWRKLIFNMLKQDDDVKER